jgi:hypothetical protein
MSIFDNFENHSLANSEAFEELCCQLFEAWGHGQKTVSRSWTYRKIRGNGGDGGIEAYWHDGEHDTFIGLQAKWFRTTLTSTQYRQLEKSIRTAVDLRPNLTRYIICLPHNLTSLKRAKRGSQSTGEESEWNDFTTRIKEEYPDLTIELWDESKIFSLLTEPDNSGYFKFWFEKSIITHDTFSFALQNALTSLHKRYQPELARIGGISEFLDSYFGDTKSYQILIAGMRDSLDAYRQLHLLIQSLTKTNAPQSTELRDSIQNCTYTANACITTLEKWISIASTEGDNPAKIDPPMANLDCFGDLKLALIKTLNDTNRHRIDTHAREIISTLELIQRLTPIHRFYEQMRTSFSDLHACVIGPQGTGKTFGFANKARCYGESKTHLPIFIPATAFSKDDTWLDVIRRTLGLSSEWDACQLWQALSCAAAINDKETEDQYLRTKVAIFVDGLDENPPTEQWCQRINEAHTITRKYPRVRFAYSSRPNFEESSHTVDSLLSKHNVAPEGDVRVSDIFDRYTDFFGIHLNDRDHYKRLIRTPMELSMFCIAYENRNVPDCVTTSLTSLATAEIKRLEVEFKNRLNPNAERRPNYIHNALYTLAVAFLKENSQFNRKDIGSKLENASIPKDLHGLILDFLEDYGILYTREHRCSSPVAPPTNTYQLGSRHLWDYYTAVVLFNEADIAFRDLQATQPDAIEMYGILLIEQEQTLPVDSREIVNAIGEHNAYRLTLTSLATASSSLSAKFKEWMFKEMRRDRDRFTSIVNEIIVPVSSVPSHPLGTLCLHEFLLTFESPIERDKFWSSSQNLFFADWRATNQNLEAFEKLPCLQQDDTWKGMPLLATWGLASLNNHWRRHFRSELIRWSIENPNEFANLFEEFYECNDPQIREDIYALAQEVVCNGKTDSYVKTKIGRLVLNSVFSEPDREGNRNASIRYHGRILIEHCHREGILEDSSLLHAKPPYALDTSANDLPLNSEALSATRMTGYGPITYDLARYVLVDDLRSAFNVQEFRSRNPVGQEENEKCRIRQPQDRTGIASFSFEGWVISAAYQYLLNHGYVAGTAAMSMHEDLDLAILRDFIPADHGQKSEVMTIAEKYTWCARNEICGYLADRIPSAEHKWMRSPYRRSDDGLSVDYGFLLNFDSPLFESSISLIDRKSTSARISFPAGFSCGDDSSIAEKQELEEWIQSFSSELAKSLLLFNPCNLEKSLGTQLPIAIYASDWSFAGKRLRAWARAGIIQRDALDNVNGTTRISVKGYENASEFIVGIEIPPHVSYSSPVEFISEPWRKEYTTEDGVIRIADVCIEAAPLTGYGVYRTIDAGEYWYDFPSFLARDHCAITQTDGQDYCTADGGVRFQTISLGTPYRREYHSLLADKNSLSKMLQSTETTLVWYITVEKSATILAHERIDGLPGNNTRSWLIWIDASEALASCSISDEIDETSEFPTVFSSQIESEEVSKVIAEYRLQLLSEKE